LYPHSIGLRRAKKEAKNPKKRQIIRQKKRIKSNVIGTGIK
jgi:hypothetical protein